jgi:hypothetical protein
MEKSEVGNLILFVKGIWQDQSTDDPTILAWIEVLGETKLALSAIKQAVLQRARAGLERPTPGQIYHEALLIEHEESERARYSRKALSEPRPSAEETARIRALLRETIEKMDAKKLKAE